MPTETRYIVPAACDLPEKELVSVAGAEQGLRFPFWERLVIARLEADAKPLPGVLYIADSTISSSHCVITQDAFGRCFVRDASRNGTRVDHRRLVPGAEIEMRIGQALTVGQECEFLLEGQAASVEAFDPRGTTPVAAPVEVTVLVGDIRRYTKLVRMMPTDVLQASVTAVIQELVTRVGEYGGTVKEYPGDAILAYWESVSPCKSAAGACRAALALDRAVPRIAADPSVWRLPPDLLQMDWALATGKVMIAAIGGAHPVGLSMIGEPIVKAFRLEKTANERTGAVVACSRTRLLAQSEIRFREIGAVTLEGFKSPEQVFAVVGVL